MFNVRINTILLVTSVFLGTIISGCGSSESEEAENSPKNLVARIDTLLNEGQYNMALELIDTLNIKYPGELELRKTTLLSRARAMEGLIRDSIPMVDSLMTSTAIEKDSLSNFFTQISVKGLEPYYVDKNIKNTNITGNNGVLPRLEGTDNHWTLTVSLPKGKNLTALQIVLNGDTVNTVINGADARTVTGSTHSMITLAGDEVQPIANCFNGKATGNIDLIAVCSNGNVKLRLSPAMQNAIWRTCRLSYITEQNRLARVKRELLERKLIVAQNQVANYQK